MEILLLIGLNLPAVPFLLDAEHGAHPAPGSGAWQVLRLHEARRTTWFAPFCLFAILYLGGLAIALAIQDADIDPRVLVNLLLIQCLLWMAVLRTRAARRRNARRERVT